MYTSTYTYTYTHKYMYIYTYRYILVHTCTIHTVYQQEYGISVFTFPPSGEHWNDPSSKHKVQIFCLGRTTGPLLPIVCRHFRFEAKWSETDAKKALFFHRSEKKCFFRLFRIDAQRRNLKRKENETKRKWNEKSENCHHFRFEAKWSETEVIFFSLWCGKGVFRLFSHLKQNEN